MPCRASLRTNGLLPSASGCQYVCAKKEYELALQDIQRPELAPLLAKAKEGELLELLALGSDGWAFGRPLGEPLAFERREAGAFRLEWVRAVFLRFSGGLRRLDTDSSTLHEHFYAEPPSCFYSRFQASARRRCLARAAELWGETEAHEASNVPTKEVARAEVYAALSALRAEDTMQEQAPGPHDRSLAEVVLDDILKASPELSQVGNPLPSPEPPPGLERGESSSSSEQPTTLEAHDADDDEGSPARKQRSKKSRRKRLERGTSDSLEGEHSPRPRPEDRPEPRRRTLWSLLQANRTGKLKTLVENLRREQQDMVRSASELQALKEKFKVALLGAHRTGQLHHVAGELATEVERRADDFQRLKERALESLLRMKRAGKLDVLAEEMRSASEAAPAEAAQSASSDDRDSAERARPLPAKQRVLQSLLEMKRSGELQLLAEEMDVAQKEFEAKAAQFREISNRMRQSMVNAKRSGELERLVGEMTEVLETQAESIRSRVRKGMLRAHRRGELQDLRQELDELADEVPSMPLASARGWTRWTEMSSDSDLEPTRREEDLSGSNEESDADAKAAAASSWQAAATKPRKRWADMTTSSDSDLDPGQAGRAVPSRFAMPKAAAKRNARPGAASSSHLSVVVNRADSESPVPDEPSPGESDAPAPAGQKDGAC
ncbi:unnamed protein product [Effrenium voratum]|uniref:Uncharacterized protein n=1 Tax=Effrenium voratum TaxID=2562239 RepID=A0AA36J691_9DINO|nr:unnamed protein product [Effrenium voratum]CAJ1445318.1 unnamed protein product [Effrenium voratum]